MNYYIIQQAVWFVEPDKPTGADMVEISGRIMPVKRLQTMRLKDQHCLIKQLMLLSTA